MTATHPVRDDIDLLDGGWYADEPHEAWDVDARARARLLRRAPATCGASPATTTCWRSRRTRRRSRAGAAPRPHGDPLPMMISMDDPEHQRRRSLVNRGFTPRRVARPRSRRSARLCTQIIDRVCERGECDFVWDIAAPLPLLLIADLLGFDAGRYDDLLRWSDDLIRATDRRADARDADAGVRAAMLGFREFQLAVIADRRAEPPRDDLISIAVPRRDRRRAARRRVDRPGDAADPDRRRRDDPPRHQRRDARAPRAPRPAARPRAADPAAHATGRRGAAALGVADQEHVPHRHAATSSCAASSSARATS